MGSLNHRIGVFVCVNKGIVPVYGIRMRRDLSMTDIGVDVVGISDGGVGLARDRMNR